MNSRAAKSWLSLSSALSVWLSFRNHPCELDYEWRPGQRSLLRNPVWQGLRRIGHWACGTVRSLSRCFVTALRLEKMPPCLPAGRHRVSPKTALAGSLVTLPSLSEWLLERRGVSNPLATRWSDKMQGPCGSNGGEPAAFC